MARPRRPQPVSGNALAPVPGSSSVYRQGANLSYKYDRHALAKRWQIEAYRYVNIIGEARYAASLFANIAGRAEIGVSEPHALTRKAVWAAIEAAAAEHAVLAEIAPTVRDRSRLIRDFMKHHVIAGECYLIARDRTPLDPDPTSPLPVWEIVGVTEIRRQGRRWQVRFDNDEWLDLRDDDPIIRIWNPDEENRREATSTFRSLLPTLREIEHLTAHIFTQVRSRLISAGVWFVPNNITFPAPPPDAVNGGTEAIARMNEAEQFMLSLAATSMQMLDKDEVAFPTVVMADPAALDAVDQSKLIQFWREIDDKAMSLRSDAVRRFALGMDLPPEQVLGSSGVAVTGAGGSAGSVNHWGVWANEEQTISAHIEPALDLFVAALTNSVLKVAVPGTPYVIAYDTATLRLRQDRSKESIELWDRGTLKTEVMLRENGFDPEHDLMDDEERRRWLVAQIAQGSATPEQVQAALKVLGVDLPVEAVPAGDPAPALPDRRRSLDNHPYEGPPREQHDHSDAPFSLLIALSEGLVLRALEKAGNRLLNDGKRGRDKDRTTPAYVAHVVAGGDRDFEQLEFDFSTAPVVLGDLPVEVQMGVVRTLRAYCAELYANREPYSRETLTAALARNLEDLA